MKNLIITGATSFIASNFINEIKADNVHIYAVVRPQTNKRKFENTDKITIIEAEMKDYGKLDSMINEKCDSLFTFAWSGTRGADRENGLIQRENFENSLAAVNAGIKLGCSSIFTAGSQAEYGLTKEVIMEDTPCKPVSEYGKWKLQLYHEVNKLCCKKNISFKEPRFFSIYGIDDYKGSMILNVLEKMMKNEPCDFTECTQKWDFLHVKDAVKGLTKLMISDCEDGIYNFGSGISKPLKDYILEMYSITGSTSQLNFGAIPFPEGRVVSIEPNVKKLMNNCKWQPEMTFEDGIKEIIKKLE